MRNTVFLKIIVTVLFFYPISVNAEEPGNICKDITIAAMQEHVPIPPSTILSKQEVNGLCEVILDINGQYVPIYAGEDYVFAGEMFQNKKQITQTRLDDLKAQNFIRLKPDIENCIAMSCAPSKKAKQTVYMMTDPVCPFCHQAESRLKEFADTHAVEFKIILSSVHPPVGRQKAVEAVCRNLNLDEYINGAWQNENKTNQYQCKQGIELIGSSEKIVSQLGINGVPVFFLENGTRIDGADMTALASALADFSVKISDAK